MICRISDIQLPKGHQDPQVEDPPSRGASLMLRTQFYLMISLVYLATLLPPDLLSYKWSLLISLELYSIPPSNCVWVWLALVLAILICQLLTCNLPSFPRFLLKSHCLGGSSHLT